MPKTKEAFVNFPNLFGHKHIYRASLLLKAKVFRQIRIS